MKKIIVIASFGLLLLCGAFFLSNNEKEAEAKYCGFAQDYVCCTFGLQCYCLDPDIEL